MESSKAGRVIIIKNNREGKVKMDDLVKAFRRNNLPASDDGAAVGRSPKCSGTGLGSGWMGPCGCQGSRHAAPASLLTTYPL